MIVYRGLTEKDLPKMKELHDKYFSDFAFPDFMQMMLGFAITDEDGEIVVAGGVRAVAETVIVTDPTKNMHMIGDALLEALNISKFACSKHGLDLLHAFVNNKGYARHLMKHGFSPRSQALFMKVSNGA